MGYALSYAFLILDVADSFLERLMDQQDDLERHILLDIEPIYKKPADKSKGEIFPTVWYRSNIEVTSMQLSLLAKSVLVAENPRLK